MREHAWIGQQIPARFWHLGNKRIHDYTAQWERFRHPRLRKHEYIAFFEPTEYGYRAMVFANWNGSWTCFFDGWGKTQEDALEEVQDNMTADGVY